MTTGSPTLFPLFLSRAVTVLRVVSTMMVFDSYESRSEGVVVPL